MAKKIKAIVKLNLPAGEATPGPPVGPALGQYGIPIMDFVNQYNERTRDQKGNIIPVEITIFEDRTFEFVTKLPPVSALIKKKLGLEKGSGEPNRKKVGTLTWEEIRQIAKEKLPDLNTSDLEAAARIVAGTAKSMGVNIRQDGKKENE